MEHSEARELLSAYVDGELEIERARALEEHLSACDDCARYMESLKAMDQSVRMTKPEAPPEGYFEFFPAKLRARIQSREKEAPSIRRIEARLARVRVTATAFVVLMAFGIGVIFGQRGLMLKSPRLVPIAIVSERARMDRMAYDEIDRGEMEELSVEGAASESEDISLSAGKEREVSEGVGRAAPSVPKTGGREDEPLVIPEEPAAEFAARSFERAKAEKKAPPDADPEEAYAVANLAQLQRDYDKALDGYERVVESSPGTELAAGAQFQINIMKVSVDTSDATEVLRKVATVWEDYIAEYPGSHLIPSACDFYTQALYSIALRTQVKSDVEKAISAIESCSTLLKDKSPSDLEEKARELRKHLDG